MQHMPGPDSSVLLLTCRPIFEDLWVRRLNATSIDHSWERDGMEPRETDLQGLPMDSFASARLNAYRSLG